MALYTYTHHLYLALGGKQYAEDYEYILNAMIARKTPGTYKFCQVINEGLYGENEATHALAECGLNEYAKPPAVGVTHYIGAIVNIETLTNFLKPKYVEWIQKLITATHTHGKYGKISIIGHGGTDATIAAYTNMGNKTMEWLTQREFIDKLFPQCPTDTPPGNQLKVISLLQCSGGRSTSAYAYFGRGGVLQPAPGSAAIVTAEVLRNKGWGGRNIEISSAPQIGLQRSTEGTVGTRTMLPQSAQYTTDREITLPRIHVINASQNTITITGESLQLGCHPNGTPKALQGDYDRVGNVYYPKSWIRQLYAGKVIFLIPEYCEVTATEPHKVKIRAEFAPQTEFPNSESTTLRKRGQAKAINIVPEVEKSPFSYWKC